MPTNAKPARAPRIVYYCSGHGYGHATRVSALARHLLRLEPYPRPAIHIVSSAPRHVFADSVACGAHYRHANIDPVIVQPLAYRVDRRKSVDVLKAFLSQKEEFLQREKKWLIEIGASCVLSDAAFLGCLAGKAAGIPSALITNFSFDSVYSYLSTAILDAHSTTSEHPLHPNHGRETGVLDALVPDTPIPWMELEPLVDQIRSGYRCADLLVLLPGYIPIPSFFEFPPLPASTWIDIETRRMDTPIIDALFKKLWDLPLVAPVPFSPSGFTIPRKVIPAPLLVRSPSTGTNVCTVAGRSRFLSLLGIPKDQQGPHTKILVVSFGGQRFHQPSRRNSFRGSRNPSRDPYEDGVAKRAPLQAAVINQVSLSRNKGRGTPSDIKDIPISPRLATESHIWVPGAPPAYKASGISTPTPTQEDFKFQAAEDYLEGPRLLPDESWIAVVCGVSKDQWMSPGEDMPQGFYVAPKEVYMPDLTLIADVLLGKLGYGTVSECVDSCTPFVYVSRPLFVEEHGLRHLLEKDGVGIELRRECYEAGDWAAAIMEAFVTGKPGKERRRSEMAGGRNLDKRDQEGRELAQTVIDWLSEWGGKLADAQCNN